MRRHAWIGVGLLPAVVAGLGGCATVTPNMDEHIAPGKEQWLTEQHLIYHIQCQLATAVQEAKKFSALNPGKAQWLDNWGAQISLTLAVNNKDNLAPGLTFTHPLQNAVSVFSKNGNVTTARSRKLGLGFNWSADATRTETLGFFYSFEELANANIDTAQCKPSQGPYLSSDLKITDFLMKGLDMSFQDGMLFPKTGESPYETFTYDVNTNTNYNPEAEARAGVFGMRSIAQYLDGLLRKGLAARAA